MHNNRSSSNAAVAPAAVPGPAAGCAPLLGVALLAVAGCSDPAAINDCQSSAQLDVICGFAKPEDLAALPDTEWLLISELGNGPDPGHVVAFNPAEQQVVRMQAANPARAPDSTFPICGAPPEKLKPRGFHLSRAADQDQLLIVNATETVRIERYRVIPGPVPGLLWEGCVVVPDHLTPNDVAAMPDGGFVISHMYTPPRTRLVTVRLLLRLDTGYAARWRPQDGWQKVVGTDAAFPNGIETDPAGRVFVAATYGQHLTAVDPDGRRRRVGLPIQPDNLTWSPDGRLIAAGHTGTPYFGTRGCAQLGSTSCAFPFAVAAIDPATLEVETIYAHSENLIPGASVALVHNNLLYLGTFFGDRISQVAIGGGL